MATRNRLSGGEECILNARRNATGVTETFWGRGSRRTAGCVIAEKKTTQFAVSDKYLKRIRKRNLERSWHLIFYEWIRVDQTGKLCWTL